MCPFFCSCVILREVTRYPPKNPYFLSAQKFVKRPYYRLVYFTRLSSSFYIQEPIPHTERTKIGWPAIRTGLEPVTFRQFPTERSTNSSTWPTGKTDGHVLHLRFELTLTIFPFFFERFPTWNNVNLVLNRIILSFKGKKLLTTYLFPLTFLNYKKQTHKLNPKKRLVDRVGLEPTIVPYFFTCRLLWGLEPHSRCPGRFTHLPPIHFSSTKIKQ